MTDKDIEDAFNSTNVIFKGDNNSIKEVKDKISKSIIVGKNFRCRKCNELKPISIIYNCNVCDIIIKNEKPLLCYQCQKIFHNACLKHWNERQKRLNKELSCNIVKSHNPILFSEVPANNLFGSNKFKALYNLFLDFIKQDSVIETMRQLLSSREDSNLMDLISYIP